MKNFKRLVAAALAATMALALSVSAFAEVEVKDAVKASYADGKAAYTETITAKDGTQMTVAIFKALDQNETLSAEKLEYINQDVNTALNLSAMGTKNNLLAQDNEGNATYAGDYVIRVGYYDANNAWQIAEGTFTVSTKAAAVLTKDILAGNVNSDTNVNATDAALILGYLSKIGSTKKGTYNTNNSAYVGSSYEKEDGTTYLAGNVNSDTNVNATDAALILGYLSKIGSTKKATYNTNNSAYVGGTVTVKAE